MRVYCPNCHAGYEIDDRLIADRSRRLECSSCGEIFTAEKLLFAIDGSDAVSDTRNAFDMLHEAMNEKEESPTVQDMSQSMPPEKDEEDVAKMNDGAAAEEIDRKEEEADGVAVQEDGDPAVGENADENSADEENVDLEKIFERLSDHTSHLLEEEKQLPFYAKAWLQIKNILGFHFKIRWFYVAAFVVFFVALSLFNNRYQIVRKVPLMNVVYKAFGIEAKIPGEGLEFQNVSWDFIEDDEGARLDIKGFVYNRTTDEIDIPVVHIEILDKDTVLLQSQNRDIEEETAAPQARIPLNLEIRNPAPTAKYVYLTFINKD